MFCLTGLVRSFHYAPLYEFRAQIFFTRLVWPAHTFNQNKWGISFRTETHIQLSDIFHRPIATMMIIIIIKCVCSHLFFFSRLRLTHYDECASAGKCGKIEIRTMKKSFHHFIFLFHMKNAHFFRNSKGKWSSLFRTKSTQSTVRCK